MLAKIKKWVFVAASLLLALPWLWFTGHPRLVLGFVAVLAGAILGFLASRVARYFWEPGSGRAQQKVKFEN